LSAAEFMIAYRGIPVVAGETTQSISSDGEDDIITICNAIGNAAANSGTEATSYEATIAGLTAQLKNAANQANCAREKTLRDVQKAFFSPLIKKPRRLR
jgi:hypothetical protein